MVEGDDGVELHVNDGEQFAVESVGEGEDEGSVVAFCGESSFDGGEGGEFDLQDAGQFAVGDVGVGADAAEYFFFVFGKCVVVHRPCNEKAP